VAEALHVVRLNVCVVSWKWTSRAPAIEQENFERSHRDCLWIKAKVMHACVKRKLIRHQWKMCNVISDYNVGKNGLPLLSQTPSQTPVMVLAELRHGVRLIIVNSMTLFFFFLFSFFLYKHKTNHRSGMTTCRSANIWHMPHNIFLIIRV